MVSEETSEYFRDSVVDCVVVVIGKGGGKKYRSNMPDLSEIFAPSDRMPLRVREMRPQQENR